MLYDYECAKCNHQEERTYSIINFPDAIPCPKCDGIAKKIIVLGHGGVQKESPAWLDDGVRAALQDTDRVRAGLDKPIETRKELNDHLKKEGLIAIG